MNQGQFEELKGLLVKANRWAMFGFLVCIFAIGGGCFAYIGYRIDVFERAQKDQVNAMTLNLRQVMEMWKDDPKNFDKTGKQIEEIRDWIRTHR